MSDEAFQTFMSGGMLLLVIGVLAVSWLLWSVRDDRRDAEEAALEGVAQELKLNLQRMLSELMALTGGTAYVTGSLMEIRHPQLNAVHSGLVLCDRRAISVMGAMYQELQARKMYLQAALETGQAAEEEYDNALYAAIDGIVTLYLWEEHKGCKPPEARSTRSWDVRKWMKANGFGQFSFPDLHLRDAVVDRLRQYGMTLTPAPLEYSAFEYWSMRYDWKKDLGAAGYRRRLRLNQKKRLLSLMVIVLKRLNLRLSQTQTLNTRLRRRLILSLMWMQGAMMSALPKTRRTVLATNWQSLRAKAMSRTLAD